MNKERVEVTDIPPSVRATYHPAMIGSKELWWHHIFYTSVQIPDDKLQEIKIAIQKILNHE